MGILDIFKRKKNNKEDLTITNEEKKDSKTISNDILKKIKQINNIEYVSDIFIERLEKYPELVELLLKGNISQEIIGTLVYEKKLYFLPTHEEDLKFIKYIEIDERIKKIVSLLNNRIDPSRIDESYISCYLDLNKESTTNEYKDQIDSFIPNHKINIDTKVLTKTAYYSSFIVYLPKTKHKIVYHNFEQFITGKIELNEDTIIQMSYMDYTLLDEKIIDKISKCKIVFSDKEKTQKIESNNQEEKTDYKLLKYNHLIYIIEKSSLKKDIKEKILYKLKNMYYEDNNYYDLEIIDEIIPYLKELKPKEINKLTEEFELNIETYKTKEIEKPKFNAKIYIDNYFSDIKSASIESVIDFIVFLPEEIKLEVIKEPRIKEKLDIPENIEEKKLQELLFLFSQRLSSTTMDFIKSLDIDIEKFMKDPNNNYSSSYDINSIISRYGIYDYIDQEITVSIADLIGHDGLSNRWKYRGRNILHTFENFFERNGDGYHTRSIGLLEYKTGEELIKELEKRNNDTKDMHIKEIEKGKYIISSNGLHRYSVLRFFYLLDCMKQEKNKEEIKELYKIPVRLSEKTNYKRTYCNYIVQLANKDIDFISNSIESDKVTIYYKQDRKHQTITEESFLSLAIQSIDLLDDYPLQEVINNYKKYDSFREFIDKYIPNFKEKIDNKKEVIQK